MQPPFFQVHIKSWTRINMKIHIKSDIVPPYHGSCLLNLQLDSKIDGQNPDSLISVGLTNVPFCSLATPQSQGNDQGMSVKYSILKRLKKRLSSRSNRSVFCTSSWCSCTSKIANGTNMPNNVLCRFCRLDIYPYLQSAPSNLALLHVL